MDTQRAKVSDICNGSKILRVPYYQRSYVWDEPEWERLLEDMENVSQGSGSFFMGSLILKQQPTPTVSDVGEIRTIIDGQQRLTTLIIMAKVLCLKEGALQKFDKRFKLDNGAPILDHNFIDRDAFNEIMNVKTLTEVSPDDPENDAGLMNPKRKDRVSCAYRYFKEHLTPEKMDFNKIFLNQVCFVVIDLLPDEDEQQIFDTVNSTGVELTTADLLKNYFFDRNNEEDYRQYWHSVFEQTEEDRVFWNREILTGRLKRTCIDLFFHSYLQIKMQEPALTVASEDKTAYARADQLFKHYKDFIKKYLGNQKQTVIDEVREYAKIFRKIIMPDVVERELPKEPGVERINAMIFGLDTTPLIPYFLYAERNAKEEEKKGLYDCLETFVMRRLVTKETTKNYNRFFTNQLIFNQLLTREELKNYLLKQESDNVNRVPGNDEVRAAFHQSALINKYARGVLYMIESRTRSDAHSTALLGMEKYSLEHMMPKKWPNHWTLKAGVSAEERNRILLTLGNLTIITQALNASIRDADWPTKKNGKGNSGGLLKYAAGLDTLSDYLDLDSWDEDTIKERADKLADSALQIWKL